MKKAELIKENEELKQRIKELEKQLQEKAGRKKELTPDEKEIIKLYRIQGKSYREIAKIFNVSHTTIANYINNNHTK